MPIIKNIRLILDDRYKNKKIMSLDFGVKRFGIAISDMGGVIATPYKNYERNDIKKDLDFLAQIIKKEEVFLVVIGLPKSLDDSFSDTSQKVKSFANLLTQKIDLDIFFWDERFSSKAAERVVEGSKEFKGDKDDKIAATLILQNFLDYKNNN